MCILRFDDLQITIKLLWATLITMGAWSLIRCLLSFLKRIYWRLTLETVRNRFRLMLIAWYLALSYGHSKVYGAIRCVPLSMNLFTTNLIPALQIESS